MTCLSAAYSNVCEDPRPDLGSESLVCLLLSAAERHLCTKSANYCIRRWTNSPRATERLSIANEGRRYSTPTVKRIMRCATGMEPVLTVLHRPADWRSRIMGLQDCVRSPRTAFVYCMIRKSTTPGQPLNVDSEHRLSRRLAARVWASEWSSMNSSGRLNH